MCRFCFYDVYCFNLKSIVFPDKYVHIIGQFYTTSNPKRNDFTGLPIYPDFIIYGKKDSFASDYANSNGYSFRVIGEDILYLPSGALGYNGRAYYGAVTMDTRTYTMAPGNIYDIGVKLVGSAHAKIRRMTSSRDGIASVRQLPNGNYRVTGLRPGTTYITYTIYNPESGKEITHASIKFDVAAGVKQMVLPAARPPTLIKKRQSPVAGVNPVTGDFFVLYSDCSVFFTILFLFLNRVNQIIGLFSNLFFYLFPNLGCFAF